MLQELKMKSLKGHAASIIIALALAAGLLWGTGFGAFKASGGPKPLDSLDVSELKGQYVEAEVYLIYDWLPIQSAPIHPQTALLSQRRNTLFR